MQKYIAFDLCYFSEHQIKGQMKQFYRPISSKISMPVYQKSKHA